tara:strand:- start:92 stop:433 length:342 start_codon:yes stop_codon:yes gene_type:complete
MKPDQELAEGIYSIVAGFIDGPKTVNELESYYLNNKTAITTMKHHSEELYQKLISKFKEQKDAINSDRVRQETTDRFGRREGQATTEQEKKHNRAERIRELSKNHPSAGFWKE